MKLGDVYLLPLDPTMGHEQNGFRPVVIISCSKFNEITRLPVVCPITTGGDFAKRRGFSVEITGTESVHGVVRCDQVRSMDIYARQGKKIDQLPSKIMDEILAKVATIFEF